MAGFFAASADMMPYYDGGEIHGRMYHIACKVWFTTNGDPIPLSFKFEGDDGELQYVGRLKVNYSEERNYSGVASKEYGCEACIGGLMREFRLLFYVEACKWVMVI